MNNNFEINEHNSNINNDDNNEKIEIENKNKIGNISITIFFIFKKIIQKKFKLNKIHFLFFNNS